MMDIQFKPINGTFAKEVSGIRVCDVNPEHVEQIKREWFACGVLVFRREGLSEDELVRFSAMFGTPEVVIRTDWVSRSRPEVSLMSNLKDSQNKPIGMPGTRDVFWHTDQSYMAEPATGAVLQAIEVPEHGGSTYWSNLQLAYAALPEDLKQEIENRRAIYDYERRLQNYDEKNRVMTDEVKKKIPARMTHSLVNVHPVTGKKSLYCDPSTTVGIEGMPEAAGQKLLDQIRQVATRPEIVYRHDWKNGDVVMWDNAFLLHRRDEFDEADIRFVKRTTLRLSEKDHILPHGRLLTVPAGGALA